MARLGFGCASLMASLDRAGSLAVLDAAFGAGIRHFDVAPSYGYGEAEAVLGEFLEGRREACTIATKFGIEPPPRALAQGAMKRMARRAAGLVPALRPVLRAAAHSMTAAPTGRRFEPAAAAASLDRSLRALRADRVDVLLMHEPGADEVRDDAVRAFLADAVASGRAGAVGVGLGADADPGETARMIDRLPPTDIVQMADSIAADPSLLRRAAPRPVTTHSALRGGLDILRDGRTGSAPSAALGGHGAAAVLLKCALDRNPGGRVLFSSRDPVRIRDTLAELRELHADPAWIDAPARLAAA